MSWRRAAPWLVLFGLLAAVGAGVLDGLGGGGGPGAGARIAAVVTRVVDGDTVRVRFGGRDEAVRYIGMDTPETVKPNAPVQCFGKAASAANHRLVGGARVELRLDAEPRDRYGRLLAYLYRRADGLFVNAELVRGGFARTLTIPPNIGHAAELGALERQARADRRGLWGACTP
ncbi:MAG TPA: thermonuclease family protein [Solirubrobacteraceae bacterium]|nr:thermonuclease family protein [Solirubrobacteraceae bacterium]